MDIRLAAGLLCILAAVACARNAGVGDTTTPITELASTAAVALPGPGTYAEEFVRLIAESEGGIRPEAQALARAD